MRDDLADIRQQVTRQVGHWTQATQRLENLDELASPQAWEGLEKYLNTAIKTSLHGSINNLKKRAVELQRQLSVAHTKEQLRRVQNEVDGYRKKYLKTEITLDFYTDAINTRTNPEIAALLRACDRLAYLSMSALLLPMGKPVPPVLTYIDKGLGASILKAGLRLWDSNTISPVAAIKVVRHNLLRPTALIHESGHQLAHILNWNEELSHALEQQLKKHSTELAEIWAGWASEIAADTFAFAHTGYAAVAALHDVISGDDQWVFRFMRFDPHPVNFIRVLLGTAMCSLCFGEGPWEQLQRVWQEKHPLHRVKSEIRMVMEHSIPLLPEIAAICLKTPKKAFLNRPLTSWLPTERVHPVALRQLEKQAGQALYNSSHWLNQEALRLLALNGYRIATQPEQVPYLLEQQRTWMIRLGNTALNFSNFSSNKRMNHDQLEYSSERTAARQSFG